MTFLPIVDRELRVAARRRATYWSRMFIALSAILIGGVILLINLGAVQSVLGEYIFMGLSVLALLYCLLSGRRSTADSLSEEKREGTLGLLFLTDLKGYDVVLGKLVATSIGAFYGLLAVFPVMAISLLLGGVTQGEIGRMALVLVDTFLFSLAIGIFSSAVCRDTRKAMGLNLALLLFFTGVLPAIAGFIAYFAPSTPLIAPLFFTSPIYAFYLSHDSRFTVEPEHFWITVGIVHALTWFFVMRASQIAPHSWQDTPTGPAKPKQAFLQRLWHEWSYGKPEKRAAYRKKLLDENAFYWLAARARLKPLHVWTFLALIAGWWLLGWINSGAMWFDETVNVALALLLNSTLKLWVAQESGSRLAEDKKIGALELLLSTPLTEKDILRGQWLALRRQFLKPLIVVLVVEFLLMEVSVRLDTRTTSATRVIWLSGMAMMLADIFTLGLVAMARGLSGKSHNQAIITTVFQVLGLPWLAFGIIIAAANVWYTLVLPSIWVPGWQFYLGWWLAFGIIADIAFSLEAWLLLNRRTRTFAMKRFTSSVGQGEVPTPKPKPEPVKLAEPLAPALSAPLATDPPPRWLTRRKSIVLGSLLALLVIVIWVGSFFHTPKHVFPPAISVPVSLGQGTVKVFVGYGVAWFLLPDDSLWCWGAGVVEVGNAIVPEQFGTNKDWALISPTHQGFVGLKRNGTVWRASLMPGGTGDADSQMAQLTPGTNWVDVSAYLNRWLGLKRDGTLWRQDDNWSGKPGPGVVAVRRNYVRVGTDSDWAAVHSFGGGMAAVKSNGTLWAWGQIAVRSSSTFAGAGMFSMNALSEPTQLCRETNWTGFEPGVGMLVRNADNEIWELFYAAPNRDAGIITVGRLMSSNQPPDHVAFAYCGKQMVFEIRQDGSLYGRDQTTRNSNPEQEKWRQIGTRTDWLSLWSANGTAFGLTKNGMIWTWGVDPTLERVPDVATKLRILQSRLRLATSPAGAGMVSTPQFVKEPRPLMRLGP